MRVSTLARARTAEVRHTKVVEAAWRTYYKAIGPATRARQEAIEEADRVYSQACAATLPAAYANLPVIERGSLAEDVTAEEAAEILGVSLGQLSEWLHDGSLTGAFYDGYWRMSRAAVVEEGQRRGLPAR